MNLIFKTPPECPECNSKNIIHDFERVESYCANCGLILKNNEFITLSDILYLHELEEIGKEAQEEKESVK